ncbi:ATP-binding protein [Amycolatopsis samaneae]|uniref:ATP-binding protein n=1 Tax=Amycolatopsis samaneae TaxID=664691 RepID=A0ABW5GX38_9PSEU
MQAGTIQQVVVERPAPAELPVPRQLPPAVRDFAGRDDQLARLDALIATCESRPTATAITTLAGTAGVGKTTLAVHWAHRVEHHFTDGTLFANLRGYGPSAPLAPGLVLTSFLRVLGVRENRIPAELDAQASLYRTVLADRRVLVLLDNASTADQVRPLLPGSPGCLVLVTSRASLTGLIVAEAASQVPLDLFALGEAKTLLRNILRSERVDAEPGAVADLIAVCARLPLALRVAATRIAIRPHTSIAELVADIVDERNRLDMLSNSGDEQSAVRTVFEWSYTGLPEEQARLFRRIGLHPGTEFGIPAAAVIADLDPAATYRQLESLADAHLLEPVGAKRYRLHDLMHAYAAHRAGLDETAEARHDIVTRLFTWYARTARAADRLLFPGLDTLDVPLAPLGHEIPLADRAEALAWLNTEQTNLMAVLRAAHACQAHDAALCLAASARSLSLREQGMWPIRLEAETLGIRAARASGNRGAEACLLGFRGDTLADLRRLTEAEADFDQQLVLAREIGDTTRHRVALVGLAQVRLLEERYFEAQHLYQRALPLARAASTRRPEAVVECNLSRISTFLGHYEQALTHAFRELELRRQTVDRVGEAYALHDVAVAHRGLGHHETAIEFATRAIAMYRELDGTGAYLALALETAASSLEQIGALTRASHYLTEACTALGESDTSRVKALRGKARALAARAGDRPLP